MKNEEATGPEKMIKRRHYATVQNFDPGVRVQLDFDIDTRDDISGPHGFRDCNVAIMISKEDAHGKTVEELIAEAWRRFDLIKPML